MPYEGVRGQISRQAHLGQRLRESAPHGCVGTTSADGRGRDQASLTWRTVGGSATPKGEAESARLGGGMRWRAQQEAFVVLLDLGLGERVEIGEKFPARSPRPRSAMRSSSSFFRT